ncbi:hypothetical protein ACQ4PT_048783 [Festuca glaucescens]
MGLCLGKTSSVTPEIAGACLCPRDPATWSWPDLPPEITGLVLSRLPSLDYRLSFAAVCHDWCLATQHQRAMLPPAMPCINFGNGVYRGLADDMARRFAKFRDSNNANASFGNWLLYYDQRMGSGRCFLHAHNSPAIEPLPDPAKECLNGCTLPTNQIRPHNLLLPRARRTRFPAASPFHDGFSATKSTESKVYDMKVGADQEELVAFLKSSSKKQPPLLDSGRCCRQTAPSATPLSAEIFCDGSGPGSAVMV